MDLNAARRKFAKKSQSWLLEERPGFLARRLHQIHVALFAELCAEFEITPVQYSVLSALSIYENADQTTIARRVALDRVTTTGALDRLLKRGLIARVVSSEDRRARQCKVTARGMSTLFKMERAARLAHRKTVAGLSETDQRTLVRLMKKLVDAHENAAIDVRKKALRRVK